MDLGLSGKVALVTGASRGIGAAICLELAREGMDICLVARDDAKMREIPAAIATFGRLDLIVNNAGATKRADFFSLTEEDWRNGFALKFHGYVRMTRAAWPHLRASKDSVVNIVGIGAGGATRSL